MLNCTIKKTKNLKHFIHCESLQIIMHHKCNLHCHTVDMQTQSVVSQDDLIKKCLLLVV